VATRKSKSIDVTIKPWWQTQLFAAVVGAALASIPYVYDKIQSNDEKRDSIGLSFLSQGYPGPYSFSDASKKTISVRLVGITFEKSDSWILIDVGSKNIRLNRGVRQGKFFGIVDNLSCDTTYQYRTEAIREGRVAAAYLSTLYLPKCETAQEIAEIEASNFFVADKTKLQDINLPPQHPLPGGFGDEIRKSADGPNR
jgi:hypothetical protein